MKDTTFTVEFVTHCLANSYRTDGNRGTEDTFQRDNNKCLVFNPSWWHSAFSQSIEIAHVRGVKAADIQVDLSVTAETEIYNRRYGDDEYRNHEAIMPGTQVTFNAVVADHVTTGVLKTLLERMGKYVGLSPYGHRLGFGKFNVIMVNVAPSDAADQAT